MLRWIQNTGQFFRTLKRCLENDRPEKIIETGHREGDYEMLTDDISLYLPDIVLKSGKSGLYSVSIAACYFNSPHVLYSSPDHRFPPAAASCLAFSSYSFTNGTCSIASSAIPTQLSAILSIL